MRKYAMGYTERIFYCSYGATFKKPTDLWHELPYSVGSAVRPHTPASRGSHDRIHSRDRGTRQSAQRFPAPSPKPSTGPCVRTRADDR